MACDALPHRARVVSVTSMTPARFETMREANLRDPHISLSFNARCPCCEPVVHGSCTGSEFDHHITHCGTYTYISLKYYYKRICILNTCHGTWASRGGHSVACHLGFRVAVFRKDEGSSRNIRVFMCRGILLSKEDMVLRSPGSTANLICTAGRSLQLSAFTPLGLHAASRRCTRHTASRAIVALSFESLQSSRCRRMFKSGYPSRISALDNRISNVRVTFADTALDGSHL